MLGGEGEAAGHEPTSIGSLTDAASSTESYRQVLKASSIIGGAQIITMMIGMVRTKLVAMLIGPAGIGLVGMFRSVTGIAGTVAGLGIQTSGVRDVAAAVGEEDQQRVAATIQTLRRICWFTGLLGCLGLYLAADLLSQRTFGSSEYVWHIRILGLTILMGNVAGGQAAIIQGTRRIGDLARMRIIGAAASTIVTVGFYWGMGIDGIIPALLSISAVTLAVSTWFARRVAITPVKLSWIETFRGAGGLLKLGLALVWSGLLVLLVSYLTVVWIAAEFDLQAVGIYTAAFALSGLFVQFVLQAMGADYYPRLTAVSHDHQQMNSLINQQTEIGLLLAFPGLLATLVFAPQAITIFYSAEFAPAADLLKWFVLGCMGRVLSWPLGFAILALNRGALFAATETIFNLVHLCGVWIAVHYFGLQYVAVAFAILYLFYTIAMLLCTRSLIGFHWNKPVVQMTVWMTLTTVSVFMLNDFLTPFWSAAVGTLISAAVSIICLRHLVAHVGANHRITKSLFRFPGGKWIAGVAADG